jgi:hypothetical protein
MQIKDVSPRFAALETLWEVLPVGRMFAPAGRSPRPAPANNPTPPGPPSGLTEGIIIDPARRAQAAFQTAGCSVQAAAIDRIQKEIKWPEAEQGLAPAGRDVIRAKLPKKGTLPHRYRAPARARKSRSAPAGTRVGHTSLPASRGRARAPAGRSRKTTSAASGTRAIKPIAPVEHRRRHTALPARPD